MDFHDLEFPNNTFDCAYSDNSYEHTFAPMIHCLEVWSVLKLGGKWLIKMPDVEEDVYSGIQLNHHHPNLYPIKFHKKLFEVCGFSIDTYTTTEDKLMNEYLLTKIKSGPEFHSSVHTALNKRKECFNG